MISKYEIICNETITIVRKIEQEATALFKSLSREVVFKTGFKHFENSYRELFRDFDDVGFEVTDSEVTILFAYRSYLFRVVIIANLFTLIANMI